ncbi:uncharacterized protein EDB93DRAFT_1242781 [Suillus bovinus]|uniref:uncharacterized protein n=1 Tax=Suillus bovinus TaxID=48563 RepID=UPI001B87F14C|nr:uncharacterized protein EDB93DRAFT_1242781 [Suillus bovinus]KAG2133630.1 hypothetical protein EDB93DRAFT_1242781 [Suillus bovinus]
MPLTINVHPESQTKAQPHSCFHRPSPEGHVQRADRSPGKSIPDTGWRGSPPIPSSDGGDSEKDWISKPPYNWSPARSAEGEELFKTKYESQCQQLHGAPFQWAVIFPKTSVRILENNSYTLHCFSTTKGASHHVPCKVSCEICRAPLFDEGKHTVLAYTIPFDFQPSCHIFYDQHIMEVCDGIPKWRGHKNDSELVQES